MDLGKIRDLHASRQAHYDAVTSINATLEALMTEDYASGKHSVKAICTAYKVSSATFYSILHAQAHPLKRGPVGPDEISAIIAAYQRGATMASMKRTFKRSHETISRVLEDAGVNR